MNALKSAGCNKEHTFTDKVSGVKAERPGLAQCLEILNTGDTLIVWRLDRFRRLQARLYLTHNAKKLFQS